MAGHPKSEFKKTRFANAIVQTGDPGLAYAETFPEKVNKLSQDDLVKRGIDYSKLPKVKAMIEEVLQGCRAQFVFLAPQAIERIQKLSENAESEKVKLEANKDILDRAGLRPPEQIQITQSDVFGSVDLNDIKNYIKSKMDEVVVDVNPIKEE